MEEGDYCKFQLWGEKKENHGLRSGGRGIQEKPTFPSTPPSQEHPEEVSISEPTSRCSENGFIWVIVRRESCRPVGKSTNRTHK